MNKEEFVKRAIEIHGNKYDYSKTIYKNIKTNIKYICPIHGEVIQNPSDHLRGRGCKKCGIEILKNKLTKTTEEFKKELQKIHDNKYILCEEYKGATKKIKFYCKNCNDYFIAMPTALLKGSGCKKCYIKKISIDYNYFIEKSKKAHGNKYDYSLVSKNLSNCLTKIKIICPHHGIFEQVVRNHYRGSGCPKCKNSKGEKRIENFLINKNINFISQKRFSNCKLKRELPFDFYLPDYNLLIEYNGEQHYNYGTLFNNTFDDFLKLKHRDWLKRKFAKDNNIKLLTISYKKYNFLEDILLDATKK